MHNKIKWQKEEEKVTTFQSFRENAKNKKHPTKHKRVTKSLEVLGYDKSIGTDEAEGQIKILEGFCYQLIIVHKKDVEDCERYSLRVNVTAFSPIPSIESV